jgi:CheY-like chemotaxis protein
MNSHIGLCYHPTTVVFVDDNKHFLQAFQFEFKDKLIGKFYYEPLKALQFLVHEYQANLFTQRCSVLSEEAADQLFSQVDLRLIHKQCEVKSRFEEIAVCVIDFMMPSMNGLELSRKIKAIHPSIRILLLTGEADNELAVEAFNEGIIDKFLKKSSSDLTAKLYQAIQELTYKYFMDLSHSILSSMNGAVDKFKRLRDPVFIEFFTRLCQEKNIAEYYIINDSGGFLLLDNQASPYWLALMNNRELEGFYDTAATEKAPESIINALKEKTKIPFFFTDEDLWTPPTDWEHYLHKAQRLDGLDTYYYAVIEKSSNDEWYPMQIVSFTHYLTDITNPR